MRNLCPICQECHSDNESEKLTREPDSDLPSEELWEVFFNAPSPKNEARREECSEGATRRS